MGEKKEKEKKKKKRKKKHSYSWGCHRLSLYPTLFPSQLPSTTIHPPFYSSALFIAVPYHTLSTPPPLLRSVMENSPQPVRGPAEVEQPPLPLQMAVDNPAPAPVAPIAPPASTPPPTAPKQPALSRSPTPGANPTNAEATTYHSPSASEYEPESPPPLPPLKSSNHHHHNHHRTPKTPKSRPVLSGRIEKSGGSAASSSATPTSTLKCSVKGCGQTFTGRNPRQSLWHHLKYYATRGLPGKADFEKAHGEAHAIMKEEAGMYYPFPPVASYRIKLTEGKTEPKGTPVERNRLSSSDYRKKNPEKAKTSARLSNFRARARKKGLANEKEIEEKVALWEKEWQDKQAKEASEVYSLLPFPPISQRQRADLMGSTFLGSCCPLSSRQMLAIFLFSYSCLSMADLGKGKVR